MNSTNKKTKAKKIIFILIGIIAIVFSILMINADCGGHESFYTYGGDAYTGIQNAGAQTANNVQDLAVINSAGFSFLFALIGLFSIAYGIFLKEKPDYTNILNQINNKLSLLEKSEEPAAPAVEYVPAEVKAEAEAETDVSFKSEEKIIEE